MDYLEVLQKLNHCHGPAGDEREIGRLLKELASPYCEECSFDALGNLIAHRKGEGQKIMFVAHMDSTGLIVTLIEETGYLRVGKLGGLFPQSVLCSPFRFKNGVCGYLVKGEMLEEKPLSVEDLYLDIGAKDAREAESMVQLGDTAVSMLPAFAAGSRLSSPYLDNRIGCIALLEAMSQLTSRENDLYFVFTVQKELGLRGAKTAAYAIDPDYGISVDITVGDGPCNDKKTGRKLGDGVAVKVMDQSVLCHPQVVKRLEILAQESGIPCQRDVAVERESDAGMIHSSRGGVLTGGISIPCRYLNTPAEMVDVSDVDACVKLIVAFAQDKI